MSTLRLFLTLTLILIFFGCSLPPGRLDHPTVIKLESGQKFVQLQISPISPGQLFVVTRPRSQNDAAETYIVSSYSLDGKVIEAQRFTIIEK